MDKRNVIIIGSGPAGLTAAIYAARAGFEPLLVAGYVYGGQLMNTTVVENFPGFPQGVDGPALMDSMLIQAQKFGTEVVFKDAIGVDFSGDTKKVTVDGAEYTADAVIIATGATPRRMQVPGEDELYGRGVSTCATCDGALYKGKTVAVVGGGDSAMEETMFLTQHADKVYVLHRRDEFRASKIMAQRVLDNPKVEVLWHTVIKQVVADQGGKFSHLKIANVQDDSVSELKVDGLFLAIGHIPVTGYLSGQLALNTEGYIESADGVHTSVNGVFVAGDVQDYIYRQAVTAAGAGCRAALEAQKWLTSK